MDEKSSLEGGISWVVTWPASSREEGGFVAADDVDGMVEEWSWVADGNDDALEIDDDVDVEEKALAAPKRAARTVDF